MEGFRYGPNDVIGNPVPTANDFGVRKFSGGTLADTTIHSADEIPHVWCGRYVTLLAVGGNGNVPEALLHLRVRRPGCRDARAEVVEVPVVETFLPVGRACKVERQGRYTFIDKVKVRLVDSRYWADVTNFGHKYVHVPAQYVEEYDRLLTGGIWAQI